MPAGAVTARIIAEQVRALSPNDAYRYADRCDKVAKANTVQLRGGAGC